jgi:hypothetical protein
VKSPKVPDFTQLQSLISLSEDPKLPDFTQLQSSISLIEDPELPDFAGPLRTQTWEEEVSRISAEIRFSTSTHIDTRGDTIRVGFAPGNGVCQCWAGINF